MFTIKTMIKWRVILGVVIFAVLVLLILKPKEKQPLLNQIGPEEVGVLKLKEASITINEDLPGRTVAYRIAEVRPQVTGIINQRLFKEGSLVKEGQQLYQIADAPYKIAYDRAVAALQRAEANASSIEAKSHRFRTLVQIDAVSRQEYDDAEANLSQARADIAIAKAAVEEATINLEYTKVYAPISGHISKSLITEGALVATNQSQPLATITQLDPIYVDMTQSSTSLSRLQRQSSDIENTPITLLLGAGEEYEHPGQLQFHEALVDITTDRVQWRALFPNRDQRLLPGLFVHVRLKLPYPNALLVPQRATQRNPDGSLSVWLVDKDHHAQKVTIIAKQAIGDAWLVDTGVQAGDLLITKGTWHLTPGKPILPIYMQEE